MVAPTRKLTYTDYEAMAVDRFRHEIIGGEEWCTPTPDLDHQTVVVNLTGMFGNHVAAQKLGRVFIAPTDVLLSRHDIVEPDLLFISKKRLSILTDKNIQGAPDLVIEVLSPYTLAEDRGPKLDLYARSGFEEYWMVDPRARTVEIREFGSRRRTRVYKDGQSFESVLLPTLSVQLSDIFGA